jgi:hypothetical protein
MKFLSLPKFFLLLALCVLPLAVSSDSLNLDEGDTVMYALQPDFHDFCHRLMIDQQADCQMPLAMFAAWFSGEVLGTKENWEVRDFNNHGEWQLRAVNLLWGAAALLALSRIGARLKIPWLPLLLAVQPYFWYYLNEARPYALELGCGAWVLVALVEFILERAAGTAWAWTLAVAGFLTFCATMLAPLPVGATVFAGAWLAWRNGWRPERKAVLVLLAGLAACVPVAGYYVLTLRHGAQGAQVWHVDAKFVAYVFYELTGMGGIGLSYADIREIARSPQLVHELLARLPQLVLPAILGLLLAATFFLGLRRRGKTDERPLLLGIFLALAVTAGVFVAGSVVLQKAFWARHYAPVFPFYVTLLGLALAGVWNHAQRWLRLLPLAACVLLAWSALDFRFAPALRKEDYRSSAEFVRPVLAEGKSIWWLASAYPAIFYGLDVSFFDPEANKLFIAFRSRTDITKMPPPDLIVLNKPDLHDPGGTVQKIIADNHYTVAARYRQFTVWTNSAAH